MPGYEAILNSKFLVLYSSAALVLEVESGTVVDWWTGRWLLKKLCRLAIHQVSS